MQELGLKAEAIAVDLKTKKAAGKDFTQVNSKGQVPALELNNGQVLTEGAVIVQYLADQKPEAQLIPKPGTPERYRCQEWLNYIGTELHKGVSPLWSDQTPDEFKTKIREAIAKKMDYLSAHLKTHAFLMGDQFTVADAYLFTILNWFPKLKIDLTKTPAVMGFMEKMKQRPAVQAALKAEGLTH
jgi:glutathione S-transferase